MHVCCHLACERLGKRLGLEVSGAGAGAAPCGKGVYSRLKGFLGSALRTPGRGEGTLGKKIGTAGAESETPSGRRGRKRKARSDGDEGGDEGGDGVAEAQSAVEIQLATPGNGGDVSSAKQPELEAEDDGNHEDQQGSPMGEGTEKGGNYRPVHEDGDIQPRTMYQAKTPLRREEKHAKRLRLSSGQMREENVEDGGEDDDDGEENVAGLRPGLSTMFQPAVDWLGARRRREFAAWKREILEEISIMESVVGA